MTSAEATPAVERQAQEAIDETTGRRLLARVEGLEASGALAPLEDAAIAMKALFDAMTPGVMARVTTLAAQAGELADELIHSGRPVLLDALRAMGAAAQEARAWDRAPRWSHLARLAHDPDTRRGLGFMLALAHHLGKRLTP